MAGSTTFTPADGAISAHVLSRAPDHGQPIQADPGNIPLITAGGTLTALVRGPEEHIWRLAFSGLTLTEAEALRTFIVDDLGGPIEPFSVAWETKRNLFVQTRRVDFTPWSLATGAGLTATFGVSDPNGLSSATRLAFTGGGSPGRWEQETDEAVSAAQSYSLSVSIRSNSGPLTDCASLGLVDSGGFIGGSSSLLISPTSDWVRYELTDTAADVGTDLLGRIRRDAAFATDFELDVWHPQLEVGSPTAFQRVDGDAYGLASVRYFDRSFSMTNRGNDDVWDVTFLVRRTKNADS